MIITISRAAKFLILFGLLGIFLAPTIGLHAQDRPERKVITRVAPQYPEELKNQQLGGIVCLSVVIGPNGSVKSVKAISGNQALVEVAIEAVKQWKFERSNSTDTEKIQFEFRPE